MARLKLDNLQFEMEGDKNSLSVEQRVSKLERKINNLYLVSYISTLISLIILTIKFI